SWSSSNASVASVNSNGLVASVAPGSATITATSEGQSAAVPVTVTNVPVASLQVSPASANLLVGQALSLTATTTDSAGNPLSGRPAVAVAVGPVAAVAVTPATATIPSQGTLELTATPKDANGNTLTGRSVTWTSSAPTQMSVSPSGLVTDLADNVTVSITATSEGQSGASVVTVQAPVASGSVPDPTLLPVASGQAPNLSAYLALNVANQPAGFSYNDPVTRVKVWKV